MWNLSYTACSFVVKEKFKREKNKNLNDEFVKRGEEGTKYENVLKVFAEYCHAHNGLEDKEDEKRLYRVNLVDEGSHEDVNYALIEIESGRYGFKSKITDKDTQVVAYNQKETDAPLMNFYLTIIVPKDPEEKNKVYKGFFFFQNYGQYGVKTETVAGLKRFFSEEFNLTLWVGNISPEIFVETVLKSENIRRVCFIKNNISSDSVDSIPFSYGREQRIIEHIKFSKHFMDKLKGYLSGASKVFEFESKDYDDVKVSVTTGGRERTIGLNNIQSVSIIESLPDDLKDAEGDIDTSRLVNIVCVQTKEYMKRVVYCWQ